MKGVLIRNLVYMVSMGMVICCTNNIEELAEIPEPETRFLGEVDWIRNFGGSGEETARSIIKTSDGGYAIVGFSNSTDGDLAGKELPVNDYWLLKLDAEGKLQWSKTYGGSKDDRGQALVQTNDGGYALTGYAMSDDGDGSNNQGFHDNWIIKVDGSGNLQWEKSFGFSGHDHSYDILQTADGGFFFVGFLDVTAARADGFTEKGNSLTRHGVGEFWGTKLDARGNIEWRRYFGGSNNDRAHAVVQAEDGGFVMIGFSESADFDISNSRGSYDFWVLKIDKNGDLLWERSFGGSGIEVSYDITRTLDNGYAIVGNTFSTDLDISKNYGESDIWLVKIDDGGDLLWERSFGGSEFDAARGIRLSRDGGFIISGNSKSADIDLTSNTGENDIWVLKTDANGLLEWQTSFGGSGLDFGFDAIENEDESILLVGEIASSDMPGVTQKGMTDVIVIKVK
ncbi:hypothetical protein FK220_013285 [Flavobacteriaceae bacterium TP-CH-4]|uniref:Bulb-type lectin domain-containing protein n=1 Tax=Pelagihabitans pacificus TaxID=2696054 RepID=A0A967ATX5_9FLAO|nr:hypothetical protein [Pelagihabitans pacificus]NHF60321.1 hypothetical protein [Pelagihabitans pacificus]